MNRAAWPAPELTHMRHLSLPTLIFPVAAHPRGAACPPELGALLARRRPPELGAELGALLARVRLLSAQPRSSAWPCVGAGAGAHPLGRVPEPGPELTLPAVGGARPPDLRHRNGNGALTRDPVCDR